MVWEMQIVVDKDCLCDFYINLPFTHKNKIPAASFHISHSVQIYRESQKHLKRTVTNVLLTMN